jgi:hypothetical protein
VSSEFGVQPSGPPRGWGPPGHGQPGLPPGASGRRYSTAFRLTVAATASAWVCIAAVLLVTVVRNGDPAEPLGATGGGGGGDKAKGQQVDGEWTVEGLLPALQGFADDEYRGDDGAGDHGFDGAYGAAVPCGGQHEQGLAPDVLETTLGGYNTLASAQILPGSAAAERELARQTEILQGCTAGYEIALEGGGMATCVPSIQTLTPAVRYEDACDDGNRPYIVAIFRADNAVVTVLTGDNTMMDWMLPSLMSELDAD